MFKNNEVFMVGLCLNLGNMNHFGEGNKLAVSKTVDVLLKREAIFVFKE